MEGERPREPSGSRYARPPFIVYFRTFPYFSLDTGVEKLYHGAHGGLGLRMPAQPKTETNTKSVTP